MPSSQLLLHTGHFPCMHHCKLKSAHERCRTYEDQNGIVRTINGKDHGDVTFAGPLYLRSSQTDKIKACHAAPTMNCGCGTRMGAPAGSSFCVLLLCRWDDCVLWRRLPCHLFQLPL